MRNSGWCWAATSDLREPEAPVAGQIRVRRHASSLNYHDYRVDSGANPKSVGRVPMSDGPGLVEAVGEGVTEFAVGDHVVSCSRTPFATRSRANTPARSASSFS